ncbi:MAG: hypothetical protein HY289_13060 [Planctomycetes bacterium]|nr:hypothetical protein [Planctomycetota bacterium]
MRTRAALLGVMLSMCVGLSFLCGQTSQPAFGEREVKSQPSELDKGKYVWAMDVRFKDPRIITIKLPTRGERICWYLWYQVINRSPDGKPQEIAPSFEIVTLDNPGLYRDEILITAEEAIKKLEDKANYQDIKNTVLISKFAIPPSKPEAFPKAVTGVAIWDAGPADPKKRDPKFKELSDTTRFSIFIRGMSNGFVEVDAPAPGLPPITQYKTLQLNFKRKGDRFSTDSRDIEFVSPAQWIYRSAGRTITFDKKDEEKDKKP